MIIWLFDYSFFSTINCRIIGLLFTAGIVRLQNFFKEAQLRNWNIKLYQFRKGIPYRDTFWKIKDEQELNIVLDVKRENIYAALKHVMHHLLRSSCSPFLSDRHSFNLSSSPCIPLLLSQTLSSSMT